jgi:ribosomal protein S18 acetylase RimI-like enzyme
MYMVIHTKNNRGVQFKILTDTDHLKLSGYLNLLSDETRGRFGPHAYDIESIQAFYLKAAHIGFIAVEEETASIVAYAIIKSGYLEHDAQRLTSYGLWLDHVTDCTFAPSVADDWQGEGLGNFILDFVLDYICFAGYQRVFLWGGVQANNERALNYYKKWGFKTLGVFEYNGMNYDMVMTLKI